MAKKQKKIKEKKLFDGKIIKRAACGYLTRFYLWLRRILGKDECVIGVDVGEDGIYSCYFQKVDSTYYLLKKTYEKKQKKKN